MVLMRRTWPVFARKPQSRISLVSAPASLESSSAMSGLAASAFSDAGTDRRSAWSSVGDSGAKENRMPGERGVYVKRPGSPWCSAPELLELTRGGPKSTVVSHAAMKAKPASSSGRKEAVSAGFGKAGLRQGEAKTDSVGRVGANEASGTSPGGNVKDRRGAAPELPTPIASFNI